MQTFTDTIVINAVQRLNLNKDNVDDEEPVKGQIIGMCCCSVVSNVINHAIL